ncbi:sulfite exporter TauE/SafE family protein [Lacibacter sediminis]|uniref:Probable membrane transporter protein n=1 Tax=Lacibacter sediminis TaxID=2760713 RepID=A0A7G5XL75_9BACT|nr:sulfite exporter TauE/SafE family protein [Lacibacter sediminis]QNA46228.1 sulfite exporter TauE/SafE family protein [Lacibacter sediminis]
MDFIYFFYILLFLVAFLYASVGHGGASGYLALMAIFSIAPDVMKPTALLLNLFVSLTSFIQFYRGGYFRMKLFLPFALASVPFAFLGGLISIDASVYKQILGWLLLLPVIRFIFFSDIQVKEQQHYSLLLAIGIGAVIGFLSGLIGIGGGIILSPVLLLLRWADMKQTAAISALFIFVNSLSGLAGQLTKGIQFTTDMYLYVIIAFAGGLAGAYIGAARLKQGMLKYMLAIVLLIAAVKLLVT